MTPREKDREIALRMGWKNTSFTPNNWGGSAMGEHPKDAERSEMSRMGVQILPRFTEDWNAAMEVRDWLGNDPNKVKRLLFLNSLKERDKSFFNVTPEDIVDAALEATK